MENTLSSASLLKATVTAIILAALIFVAIVMPAEFQQDPSGIGKALGLTKISQAAEPEQLNPAIDDTPAREDIIEVIVPAKRGIEYKLTMKQFDKVAYEWSSDTALYFDLHGEPEGDETGYFESYAIATLAKMNGSFTTPFDGIHGWYWKNSSEQAVIVRLKVKGQYQLPK